MEGDLRQILDAGLAAADPKAAVLRSLELGGDRILAGGESFEPERVFVLSAGKAACAMAQAAEQLLGDRISGGLVVTKEGHDEAPLESLEILVASHPEPDERGVEAARRVVELLEGLGEGDLLLALISGGASALLADPAPPIELEGLKRLTRALLRSGATIGEINATRKHISTLKGGGLVRLASPARTLALLLSDVVGDDVSSIASGLTAPDPTTLDWVRKIVERYALELPGSVREHLRGDPETPDRKSTRLNSSHANISYAVFCLKKNTPAPHYSPTRGVSHHSFLGQHRIRRSRPTDSIHLHHVRRPLRRFTSHFRVPSSIPMLTC